MNRTKEDGELIQAAREALRRAHAPYSNFPVGAALRSASGRIHQGCNLESSSYGLTVCAERHALHAAVLQGDRGPFTDLAVVTTAPRPVQPCGACRQVLAELCGPDLRILAIAASGETETTTLGELFPRAFHLRRLEGGDET